MTISQFRSLLYKSAKYLGDFSAVKKGKVLPRVRNRIVGRISARLIGKIFKF